MATTLCSFATANKAFTPEECERIKGMGAALALKDAQTSTAGGDKAVTALTRNCEIAWVKRTNEDWVWVFDRIWEKAQAINDKRWGFELNGPTEIQYTSYTFGMFYGAHFDNGSEDTKLRKVSVSLQLSAPSEYWGGALRLWSMNKPMVAPKEQGALVFFPSYLMHVAKPVFFGRRQALVTWFNGDQPLR